MLERSYTIPLRRGFRNAPKYYRSRRAIATLRAFLARHMKVEEDKVRIGAHLNEYLWRNGIKHPPPRVKVLARKDDAGIVRAELEGKEFKESVKPLTKTEGPTGIKGKLQQALGGKKESLEEQASVKPGEGGEKPDEKAEARHSPKSGLRQKKQAKKAIS